VHVPMSVLMSDFQDVERAAASSRAFDADHAPGRALLIATRALHPHGH